MVRVRGRGRRPLGVVVLAWLGLVSSVWGQSPEEIFIRGNAAYERGDFAEAVQAYKTVIKYQIRDARVEYNLGNAEFRLGQLGRAILHFERARRLDPTDPDIRANLAYARSFCFDQVPLPEAPALVRWIRAAQDRLGPDRQAWAILVLGWILCGLVGWGLAKPGRWNAVYGWLLAALLSLLLIVVVSWYASYQRLEGTSSAVVLQPSVEVLAGPGENNATLFTVHEGLIVEMRDVRADWIQVSLPDGLNGWLSRGAVEPV